MLDNCAVNQKYLFLLQKRHKIVPLLFKNSYNLVTHFSKQFTENYYFFFNFRVD